MWNVVYSKVWGVKSEVQKAECRMWTVKCGGVKCGV